MKDAELVAALRQLKVNTKSLACLGCGYEHNCSIHGCHLIGMSADELAEYAAALESIKAMHKEAKGAEKDYLRYVMSFFDPAYGNPAYPPRNTVREPNMDPLNFTIDAFVNSLKAVPPRKWFTDFELCADTKELAQTLQFIDKHGYTMVSATQDASGAYTVFFRRPACE